MRPTMWIATLLLAVCFGAQAQQHQSSAYRYRWVDATGLPHYSDALTVKAIKFGYDVLGADGHVIRHVPRPPTAAQREADAAQAARQRDAENSAADARRKNQRLLAAYPTEASFKAAQQARIQQLDQHIHTTHLNLNSQEQNLAELLARAADFSRQGQPAPHALAKRIAKQRETVNAQRTLLKQQLARRTQAKKDVAAKLAHYRRLQAQQHPTSGD